MSGTKNNVLRTSLLFNIFTLNQAISRLLNNALRNNPLTPTEYTTYSALFELETTSPTQLAQHLSIQLTTFMNQLKLLEHRTHTSQIDNPNNQHSYLMTLTTTKQLTHHKTNQQFKQTYMAFVDTLEVTKNTAQKTLHNLRATANKAQSTHTSSSH